MSAMIDLGSRIEEASHSRINVAGDSRIGPASYPGVVDFGPLLERLPAIGLEDLASQAALLKRTDRKYLLNRALTAELVEYLCSIQAEVLSIGGAREFGYLSDYFDTPDFALYRAAATKRRRRFKVRSRVYLDAGLRFVELKTRSGRGQNVKDRLRLDDVPMDVCERLKRGLPVEAFDLVEVAVGDDLAAAQANLLVQHSAQEVLHVQLSLHIDVGTLRGNLGHGDEPALGLVSLIDDRVVLLRRPSLGDAGLDLLHIAHEGRLDEPRPSGLLDGGDQPRILGHRDGNAVFSLARAKFPGLLNHLGQRTNLVHNQISSLLYWIPKKPSIE